MATTGIGYVALIWDCRNSEELQQITLEIVEKNLLSKALTGMIIKKSKELKAKENQATR